MPGLFSALLSRTEPKQATRRRADMRFERLRTDAAFELRRYPPRVVVETIVTGPFRRARGDGFHRLAAYLFGQNASHRRISMTTPALRDGMFIDPPGEGDGSDGGSEHRVAFVVPEEHRLETLPAPNDPRVVLRAVPAITVAVLGFSGRTSARTWKRHAADLEAWVSSEGLLPAARPSLAEYDPPWVPGRYRRSEAWLPVRVTEPRL